MRSLYKMLGIDDYGIHITCLHIMAILFHIIYKIRLGNANCISRLIDLLWSKTRNQIYIPYIMLSVNWKHELLIDMAS